MYSINQIRASFQQPIVNNIPNHLKAGRQHVLWRAELRRDGKISKTPYIARALLESNKIYRASTTKPRSWSTFPQVIKAYQTHKNDYDGIGYVLTKGTILVDIDHCVEPETGIPVAAAQDIITCLNSYTERSPSDGIHIFITGTLPEDIKNISHYKGLKIEIYGAGRYSTLTGQPVPHVPIQEVQSRDITTFLQEIIKPEEENTSVCVCV